MSEIEYQKFDKLLKYLPKSKIKAGDGKKSGKYSFFTSSSKLSKFIDTATYEDDSLIFGSGGSASIHYCGTPFATSTDCFVTVKDNDEIDLKYVYYFLKSNLHILEAGFKGAGLKHISKKYISNIKIPILPLPEQQKIALFLTRIEALIQKREESIQLLDELIKSTFLDMFGDPVLNPKGWEKKPLNFFVNFLSGGTPSKSNSKFWGGVFPWVSPKDMKTKYIYDAIDSITELVFEETALKKIPINSILLVVRGMILAHTVPFALTKKLVAINQDIKALIIEKDINNLFLLSSLMSQEKNILNKVSTAAHGTKKLDMPIVESLPIIYPPKPLQDKFASIVTKIEATKAQYQSSLDELNNLFNATAQKAFKGELNLGKIAVIEEEINKKALQMLDENKILALIKSGNFEAKDYVNDQQSYDDIRDKVLKLMGEGKITQKFTTDKKMVLETN